MPGPKVTIDRRALDVAAKKWVEKQVPYATALALNSIAAGVKTDIVASMKASFDRPTPWTLNAFRVDKATKSNLTATVQMREFAPNGTPAWKYLAPQIEGGARNQKRFEKALQITNQAAAFALPAEGAKLNAYGNVSVAQITQVLSGVGAFAENGYTANATVRSGKRKKRLVHQSSFRGASSFFIGGTASRNVARNKDRAETRPVAIYEVVGKGKVKPIFWLTDEAPVYKSRWDYQGTVLASVKTHQVGAFDRAMVQALATAK